MACITTRHTQGQQCVSFLSNLLGHAKQVHTSKTSSLPGVASSRGGCDAQLQRLLHTFDALAF